MRECRTPYLSLVMLLFVLAFSGALDAQYWFQFGVRAGSNSNSNNGAGVSIQTISPQTATSGSLGFWVGENLENGAFVQTGYVIENQSGQYPSLCDPSGCKKYQDINAGDAEWFYEYFPPGYSGGFLGMVGPDQSAGASGSFHTYSLRSVGGTWYFAFDGNIVGNVSLGVSASGTYAPVAFGEIANTSNNSGLITQVMFQNLSIYKNGALIPVAQASSYIGYGLGSRLDLRNPYGVKEIGSRVNYFAVGSGLPQPQNGTELWSLGYKLNLVSRYGNMSTSGKYIAYSSVQVSAPTIVQINGTTRAMFAGWRGTGSGSYTGPLNTVTVLMGSNTTEAVDWQLQYYVNVSSQFQSAYGSGWYDANSVLSYGVNGNVIQTNSTVRFVFSGWSNGNSAINGTVLVTKPMTMVGGWRKQFLVNATSQYGNVVGTGWYDNNSVAALSLSTVMVNVNSTQKIGFYQWSNGNRSARINVEVNGPITISAVFRNLYLVRLVPLDAYGNGIGNVTFYIGNNAIENNTFFFEGLDYHINYAYYKGTRVSMSSHFTPMAPGATLLKLPIYDIMLQTKDMFNNPVNALVNVQLSDGTRVSAYTGSSGRISFGDLPYGYANGTANYLGVTQGFQTRDGSVGTLVFLSLANILAFVVVAMGIAVAYFIARFQHRRRLGARRPATNR